MPPQEQADLWMALRDRMKSDWNEMTPQEKKTAYWIAFGPHGPRRADPPGENWEVFKLCVRYTIISAIIFIVIRQFARPPPKTLSKEWEEATNEYFKKEKIEPITGVSSENYKGPGQVQSKATGIKREDVEDDDDDDE